MELPEWNEYTHGTDGAMIFDVANNTDVSKMVAPHPQARFCKELWMPYYEHKGWLKHVAFWDHVHSTEDASTSAGSVFAALFLLAMCFAMACGGMWYLDPNRGPGLDPEVDIANSPWKQVAEEESPHPTEQSEGVVLA